MIDFIIPTINQFDSYINIFNSLKLQCLKNFKVIVVHQGNTPFNMELLKGLDFLYISTPIYGLSYARNLAISKSTSPYISLLDDDAYLDNDYSSRIIEIFKSYPVDVICGKVIDPITNNSISRRASFYNYSFLLKKNNYDLFISTTISFKRHIFLNYDFDTNFGVGAKYGASEEMDIFLNIINGYSVLFNPNLVVWHFSDNNKMSGYSYRKIFNRGFSYGVGRGAVYKKYTSRSSIWFFLKFVYSLVIHTLVICYDIFRFNFNIMLRDIGSLLGRVYGFISYKD